MKAKNLTIKEIAKMAGVSTATVSLVLNNKKGVGAATKKKVLEIIETTNYIPNKNSLRLFYKKSFNICLATSPTSSPFSDLFYLEFTKGLLEQSLVYGYNIVISQRQNEASANNYIPQVIKNRDADGAIFLQDVPNVVLNNIQSLNIPFVVVDAHTNNSEYTMINVDCELSAYTAVKYLINKGHKKIAFIGSSYLPEFYMRASNGYMRALDEDNIAIKHSLIQKDAHDIASAYGCMESIMTNNCSSLPTAVFCAGDLYAIGAMDCVKEKGFSVPDDISFIGMDDILLSRHVTPKLTTIGYDKTQMGRLAMDMIIKKINNEKVNSIIVKSDTIIERQSVKTINI